MKNSATEEPRRSRLLLDVIALQRAQIDELESALNHGLNVVLQPTPDEASPAWIEKTYLSAEQMSGTVVEVPEEHRRWRDTAAALSRANERNVELDRNNEHLLQKLRAKEAEVDKLKGQLEQANRHIDELAKRSLARLAGENSGQTWPQRTIGGKPASALRLGADLYAYPGNAPFGTVEFWAVKASSINGDYGVYVAESRLTLQRALRDICAKPESKFTHVFLEV